ncbi:MAG TPA: NAD(P)/FAD-dependent oxidoreductase [Alphaproteobacteria bacterium]
MILDYDVVIVGAGAAGVGAARRLAGTGLSVLVLEATARVGGRAWTETLRDMPLDLGCGWFHSADRSPWVGLAEAAGFAVDRSPSAWRQQYRDIGFTAAEQEAAEREWAAWRDGLEAAARGSDRASDALPPGGQWASYAEALSGYISGAPLAEVSAADYLAYDRASSSVNWRTPAGFGSLVAASLPPVPLRLATPVTAIDDSGAELRLETPAGTVLARAAILTVSTAALVSGALHLPAGLDDRLHAASCLPLGLANKLFLAIEGPSPFEPETHVMGNPRRAETGSYYIRPFGRPVIECYLGGAGARALEAAGLDAAFAFARDELVALFGSEIRNRLRALAGSAWGEARWFGGSYSYARPGEAARRRELAAPWQERLFFAGEATHRTDFSTAHGAYESGVRAAEEAIAALGRYRVA